MSGTCLSFLSDTDIYTATVVIIEQGVLLLETKTCSPYETFVKNLINNEQIRTDHRL